MERPWLGKHGGGPCFQHDEVWGKKRIRLTERVLFAPERKARPGVSQRVEGMSTTCDPAAHGAT